MFKKGASLILSLSIIFGVSKVSAFADNKVDSNPIEVTSEDYMVTEGQINLDGIELKLTDEGDLVINPANNTYSLNKELEELNTHLEDVPELKDAIIEDLVNDATTEVKAIGYSEVMIKEVKDKKGKVLRTEPVTKKEYQENISTFGYASGTPQTYGGYLRLYTIGESVNSGGNKHLYGKTLAKWMKSSVSSKYAPASGDDSIAISLPSRYTIYSKSLWTDVKTSNRCTLDAKNAVSYAYNEKFTQGLYAVKSAELGVTGRITGTKSAYEKISSSYVHTYGSVTVTPSINSSGIINFGISSSAKAWTLASSVTATF